MNFCLRLFLGTRRGLSGFLRVPNLKGEKVIMKNVPMSFSFSKIVNFLSAYGTVDDVFLLLHL